MLGFPERRQGGERRGKELFAFEAWALIVAALWVLIALVMVRP